MNPVLPEFGGQRNTFPVVQVDTLEWRGANHLARASPRGLQPTSAR